MICKSDVTYALTVWFWIGQSDVIQWIIFFSFVISQALNRLHQLEILGQRLVVEFAKNQHKDLASKERTRYSILIYLLKIKNTKNIQNSNKWVLKKLTKQNIHFLFWTFQVVTKAKWYERYWYRKIKNIKWTIERKSWNSIRTIHWDWQSQLFLGVYKYDVSCMDVPHRATIQNVKLYILRIISEIYIW